MIFGVLLGLLLILILAQLVSKGHAIVAWHVHQNAADEAAYTNAVWHAQGMNLLVSVNLATTAVVGMLVALRVAVVAAALSVVVQTDAPLAGPATQDSNLVENLDRVLERGQQITDSALGVLEGLQAAQSTIAAYAPVLAAIQASQQQRSSFAVCSSSSSLLPVPVVSSKTEFATQRLGGNRSLPVERARNSILCDKAKAGWPDQPQLLPQVLRRIHGSPAGASATLQRWGLRPSNAASWVQYVANLVDAEALAGRSAVCGTPFLEALRRAVAESSVVASDAVDVGMAPPAVGSDAVMSGENASAVQSDARARALATQLVHVLEGSGGEGAGPALWPGVAVWPLAQNGNVFLRSAASVTWTASMRDAALGASSSEHYPTTENGIGVGATWAHAETYFDCAGDWQQCEPVAMWQPRWRARLRRAEPWGTMLARMGLDARFYASPEMGREIQSLVADGIVGTDAHAAEQLWLQLRASEPMRVQELLPAQHADANRNPLWTFLKDQANESAALY